MNFIVETEAMDVYNHMAFDELCALSASDKNIYLRFYNWSEDSAATFGYAQSLSAVEREMAQCNFNLPHTRRPTGGGVVYHKDDLTFSIIFPSKDLKLKDVYYKLHSVINSFLNNSYAMFNKESSYEPQSSGVASACFTNPVESDLLSGDGQKVLGGALRKMDKVYLYQGSFQCPSARTAGALKENITNAISMFFGVQFERFIPAEIFMQKVHKEAAQKYQSMDWINKF